MLQAIYLSTSHYNDAASITLNMSPGVLLAIPRQTLGVSAYTHARLIGGTNIDFTSSDTAQVQSDIGDLLSCCSISRIKSVAFE